MSAAGPLAAALFDLQRPERIASCQLVDEKLREAVPARFACDAVGRVVDLAADQVDHLGGVGAVDVDCGMALP